MSHEPKIRLAVVGSRGFTDQDFVYRKLNDLLRLYTFPWEVQIISGGARGVDTLAKKYAVAMGNPYLEFPADWAKHGRAAGMIRNSEIIRQSDEVVAFWDGKSAGTRDSIFKAIDARKTLHIYFFDPQTGEPLEPRG